MSFQRAAILCMITWSAYSCSKEQVDLRQQVKRLQREKASAEASVHRLEAESMAKDQYLVSITTLLNEVGDRVEYIQHEQHELVILTATPGLEGKQFVRTKEIPQALVRISGYLAKNNEQIARLEALVGTKEKEGQGLRAVIGRLKKQNGDLESQLKTLRLSLTSLTKDVKHLKSEVVTLEGRVAEKDLKAQEQEAILAEQAENLSKVEAERWTGFYVVGTRKELRDKGVITESRGLLRLVRKPQLSENLLAIEEKFVRIDTRLVQEIPLGTLRDSLELLPARPSSSYSIERRKDGAYLLVRDSSEFWRLRYLVALVK
jgi:CII-binding regulator of phage lambda lysogenization HflD